MESPAKKLCTEEGAKVNRESVKIEDDVIHQSSFSSFKNFKLKRILNQMEQQKKLFLLAQVDRSSDDCVLILEKKPFNVEAIPKILTEETKMEQIFQNDIYSSYDGFTTPQLNPLQVTMIYPATERHIQKYTAQELHMVAESPEMYRNTVLPHIQQQQFSLQWLYNILDHKAESERILFEDPDPEKGFILLPDLKWDGKNCSQLYILAICHRRDLKSLRDLTADHVPLLQNIKTKTLSVVQEKYGLSAGQLRIYLHYQPSYYHLHVHICALTCEAPGIQCERGHLLNTVLCNLNLMSDYYQKATLTYAITSSDSVYKRISDYQSQENST